MLLSRVSFLPSSDLRSQKGGLRTKGTFKNSSLACPLVTVDTAVYNWEAHLEETAAQEIELSRS